MRLAAFSDSHGDVNGLRWGIEQVSKEKCVDAYLFLGDGANDFMSLQSLMHRLSPHALIYAVRGNNDFANVDLPMQMVLSFSGVKIMLTHGHEYQVKSSCTLLAHVARSEGCRIALFGHTHKTFMDDVSGVWLLNPGAIGYGPNVSALTVDIDQNGQFKSDIVFL